MHYYSKLLNPVSRTLISAIFLISGVGKVFAFEQTLSLMSTVGFPLPYLFLIAAIVIEVVCGLFVIVGLYTRISAAFLILFVVIATIMFHLRLTGDMAADQNQIAHTLKNLAIIGGLLKFVIEGGGYASIDWWREWKEVVV